MNTIIEYKIVKLITIDNIKELNKLGYDGWELIKCDTINDQFGDIIKIKNAIFKKIII